MCLVRSISSRGNLQRSHYQKSCCEKKKTERADEDREIQWNKYKESTFDRNRKAPSSEAEEMGSKSILKK